MLTDEDWQDIQIALPIVLSSSSTRSIDIASKNASYDRVWSACVDHSIDFASWNFRQALKQVKKLCVVLHPDHNRDHCETATAWFICLERVKQWFEKLHKNPEDVQTLSSWCQQIVNLSNMERMVQEAAARDRELADHKVQQETRRQKLRDAQVQDQVKMYLYRAPSCLSFVAPLTLATHIIAHLERIAPKRPDFKQAIYSLHTWSRNEQMVVSDHLDRQYCDVHERAVAESFANRTCIVLGSVLASSLHREPSETSDLIAAPIVDPAFHCSACAKLSADVNDSAIRARRLVRELAHSPFDTMLCCALVRQRCNIPPQQRPLISIRSLLADRVVVPLTLLLHDWLLSPMSFFENAKRHNEQQVRSFTEWLDDQFAGQGASCRMFAKLVYLHMDYSQKGNAPVSRI